VSTTFNPDTFLARLHERQTERGDDAICDNCGAGLTETDRELGFCTQCRTNFSDDGEDLRDDGYGDY
jgi:hypothetical protein